ncbi:MAG: hypothetical protein ABIO24_02405 [Saprospiraceae bacterium]
MGFINVNLLSDPYFQDGLNARYEAIINLAQNPEIQRFEAIINQEGKAVINMSNEVLRLMVIENADYLSYQRGVEQGKIIKRDFQHDRFQCMVESAFYGFDGRNIVYAALSLDDNGVNYYGDLSVVLKTKSIEKRTTFFERDTFLVYKELTAMGWRLDEDLPAGYCGTWPERHKTAVIKHGAAIQASQEIADFAALILKNGDDRTNDEFIELHIFNTIVPNNFEKVTFQKKLVRSFDQLQFEILKSKLTDLQVEVIEA